MSEEPSQTPTTLDPLAVETIHRIIGLLETTSIDQIQFRRNDSFNWDVVYIPRFKLDEITVSFVIRGT